MDKKLLMYGGAAAAGLVLVLLLGRASSSSAGGSSQAVAAQESVAFGAQQVAGNQAAYQAQTAIAGYNAALAGKAIDANLSAQTHVLSTMATLHGIDAGLAAQRGQQQAGIAAAQINEQTALGISLNQAKTAQALAPIYAHEQTVLANTASQNTMAQINATRGVQQTQATNGLIENLVNAGAKFAQPVSSLIGNLLGAGGSGAALTAGAAPVADSLASMGAGGFLSDAAVNAATTGALASGAGDALGSAIAGLA